MNWNSVIINGSWKGETAGGCQDFPTFTNNPQFVVDLEEDVDGDGKCSVLITLMQKNRRQHKRMGIQELQIGYAIYKANPLTCDYSFSQFHFLQASEGKNKVDKQYVDSNESVATSGSHTSRRNVSERFELPPGRYIIIPSSSKPNEEGDFLLRIFTETAPW